MTEPRSYTVVGAGAVGLLYGTRLAVAGHRVRWVVRTGAEQIRAQGIEVHSAGEVLRIAPDDVEVVTDPAAAEPSDTVIIALKTTANARLETLVAPAVAEGATVAVFQNGLGVEARVREAVPHARAVLGALCFVCAQRREPGRADHIDYGAVTVGESGRVGPSPAAAGLVDDLVRAGVEASAVDDLDIARWRKLVWNVPFNGLSVLLDAGTDELLSDTSARALIGVLMDEVIAASAACGHPVEVGFRQQMLDMTDAMKPYAPSMKLDRDGGRPLELAAIYDAPIAAARAAGTPMIAVEMLARSLHFLAKRTSATGGGASVSPS